MDGLPTLKKEQTLHREAFDRLLACLGTDRESAGEKYESIRRKLIKFFEWRGSEASEEHADETIDRVARRLAEGEEIRNLSAYFSGVARLVLLEALKLREKTRAAYEELPPPLETIEESDEHQTRVECFETCLQGLPAENRELITEYYQEEKHAKIECRKDLALRLGVPLNALRIRAHRIRMKLEKCVGACMKQLPET